MTSEPLTQWRPSDRISCNCRQSFTRVGKLKSFFLSPSFCSWSKGHREIHVHSSHEAKGKWQGTHKGWMSQGRTLFYSRVSAYTHTQLRPLRSKRRASLSLSLISLYDDDIRPETKHILILILRLGRNSFFSLREPSLLAKGKDGGRERGRE